MNSSEELEVLNGHLLGLDTEFVVQLPLRSMLHAQDSSIKFRSSFAGNTQWVGAAGVGPHVREGNFLAGALLEQKAFAGIEQEDREGAMEKTFVNVRHKMAYREIDAVSVQVLSTLCTFAPPREECFGREQGSIN